MNNDAIKTALINAAAKSGINLDTIEVTEEDLMFYGARRAYGRGIVVRNVPDNAAARVGKYLRARLGSDFYWDTPAAGVISVQRLVVD